MAVGTSRLTCSVVPPRLPWAESAGSVIQDDYQ